jgi:hypothetical protein
MFKTVTNRNVTMSADNTIGILVTRRRDGQHGLEFRVAHAKAIETIEEDSDYPSKDSAVFNRERVRALFMSSPVFFSIEEAFLLAWKLEEKIGYVEYGIRKLDYSRVYFPASNRKRKRRWFSRQRAEV